MECLGHINRIDSSHSILFHKHKASKSGIIRSWHWHDSVWPDRFDHDNARYGHLDADSTCFTGSAADVGKSMPSAKSAMRESCITLLGAPSAFSRAKFHLQSHKTNSVGIFMPLKLA